MRGLYAILSCGFSLLVAANPVSAHSQKLLDVFGDASAQKHKPLPAPQPYATFIGHNSQDRTNTEVYLHDRMKDMFPNQTVTVTTDYRFSPLRFAAGASDRVQLRESDDIEALKVVYFSKPPRRRDGDGNVFEVVSFGGFDIAYKDSDMKAIVASWREGFSQIVQWHIISDDAKVAHEFIRECAAWGTTVRDAVLIFDDGFWQPDFALYQEVQKADWADVILDEEFKHKLQHDYRSFLKSEAMYKDLGVPWKRGLIFLGPPGNGKTISLKAIMKDVHLPLLYVKSFRSYGGDESGIREIFRRARAEAPCILVMEDLDSLITNQNRAFFLNELDGLEDNDGLLLIGTTHPFDRLDPALSNRPSRFDRKYNFPNPNKDERKQYALYWKHKLAGNKDVEFPKDLEDEVAERTDKFSFAYLKEAFVSTLLTIAGREPGTTPPNFRETLFGQIQALRDSLDQVDELAEDAANSSKDYGVASDGGYYGGDEGPWALASRRTDRDLKRGGALWNLIVDEL